MRGFKILMIFLVLNAIINFFGLSKIGTANTLNSDYFLNSFIFGNWRTVSFSLLVPIAYTLFLSCLILLVSRSHPSILIYIALLFFVFCSIMFYSNQGGYYLRYTSIGIGGLAFGYITRNNLGRLQKNILLIFCAFLIYILLISFYKQPYPIYFFGTVIVLTLIYFSSSFVMKIFPYIFDQMLIWGRYTLMLYIFQIFLLQILRRTAPLSAMPMINCLGAFLLTIFSMLLLCICMEYSRSHWTFVNNIYKSIFE